MTKEYKHFKVKVRKVTEEDIKIRDKVVEKFYDSVSKDYHEGHLGRFCDEILEYFILHFLPKPPQKLLDLGGGVGRFAIPLAKRGYNVVLTDISGGMLESAKKIAEKQNIQLTYEKYPATDLGSLTSESFDAIISMNNVLNYCSDYDGAMSEAHRILKSDGLFIGSVNNLFAYATSNELREGNLELFKESMKTGNRYIIWGEDGQGHVTHEFTQKELYSALQRRGFRDLRILGVFNLLGKYFQSKSFLDKINKEAFFKLQLQYAQKTEYINNSTDFFFICKK